MPPPSALAEPEWSREERADSGVAGGGGDGGHGVFGVSSDGMKLAREPIHSS